MTIKGMTDNYRTPPILLSEANQGEEFPAEVQILKTGSFKDPRYGRFEITEKLLSELVSNFKKGVRGIKPAIDFKHDTEAEAAAWITDVWTKTVGTVTELWAKPDWTGLGRRSLSDKTYGYLSADFSQNYEDNELGVKHGAVLLGAALTNRPVIKGMKPVIQLSEGDTMSKPEDKKLADLQPADLEKISALMEQFKVSSIDDLIAAVAALKNDENTEVAAKAETEKQLSEKSTKLSEVMAENTTLKSEVQAMKDEKEAASKEQKFNLMLSEGKAIPAQKDAWMKNDLVKFAELAPKGGVKTDPKGSEAGAGDESLDDDDKVMKLAEAKMKDDPKLDLGSAISQVKKEQANK
jgi:phage I-like protein